MSRQPRILVLFGNVPLLGQERANIETLHALMEAGCAVRFLIRGEYTHDSIQPELARRGIEFVAVPFFDTLRYGVPLRIWWRNAVHICRGSWALLKQIRSFRATHIHAGSTANVFNFLPALWLTRLPLIFRAGDQPPQHHALWRWTWSFTQRRAAYFVCDSEFIRRCLIGLGVCEKRTTVIYAPAPRRPAITALPKMEPPADAMVSVLYLGQLNENKGVHLLIDAAERLLRRRNDIRFIVAGAFDWHNPFAENLMKRVADQGFGDRIQFPGFVENIDGLYFGMTVHACPTIGDEPYGLTVVEAKQHATPSIVFPSGGLTELITDGVDGWICKSKTAAALEEAIERYADQPSRLVQQGEAARASLDRLGVRHYGDRWMQVYQRVDAAKQPGSADQ